MRKLAALFCMLAGFAVLLSGCDDLAESNGSATGSDGVNYSAMDKAESRIRRAADAAIIEKYGPVDFSCYEIDSWPNAASTGDDDVYFVEYNLKIHGYGVDESFHVQLSSDYAAVYASDVNFGKYSCYLEGATEEAVSAAKARMTERMKEYRYEEEPHPSMVIDEEGYLCLRSEYIVDLDPPLDENGNEMQGCGKDHDHIYVSERICPKP